MENGDKASHPHKLEFVDFWGFIHGDNISTFQYIEAYWVNSSAFLDPVQFPLYFNSTEWNLNRN